jgi:type VI protein secretion system component VasF
LPRQAPETARPALGPRHRRRLDRSRRIREELLVLVVFLVALGVTVFLLASQWLQNSTVTGTVGAPVPAIQVPLPTTSSTN